MRNNIFNVVLEFGDVKETTTEGDNTSTVTDKASRKFNQNFSRLRYKVRGRTKCVGFLLQLHFSCCLQINCLNINLYSLPAGTGSNFKTEDTVFNHTDRPLAGKQHIYFFKI